MHPPEPGTSSRVWKASASLAGAAALNARGEAIDGAHGLWRNGCWHDLLDFVPEGTLAPGQTIWTHDLNDEGVVFVSVAAEETSPNSPEGQAAGAAVLPPCSLEIWNGQMPFYPKNSGPPPPVKDKFTTGAFTVANQNDTDGNGKPDKDDTKGVLGEADLMRLNVNGFLNMPGHAKLSVKAGSVALWEDSDKTRKIELDANHAVLIAIPNGGLDTTFWVEATAPSTAVGDIEIWLGHQPPQGALRDGMDKVKATGIWAVAGVNDGIILTGGRPDDLDGKDAKDTFQDFHASKFGIFDARPGKAEFYYSIGLEFKVLPSGVGNQACVKFDLSRQKEQSSWVEDVTQGWVAGPTLPFPKTPDEPNDDASFADEDREPTNDHIYCLDNPAIPIPPPGAPSRRIVKRANFREFVRVKVNGRAFRNLNNEREGSRCSDFLAWRMRGDIKLNNGAWELTAGGSNELQGGHAPLGNNP